MCRPITTPLSSSPSTKLRVSEPTKTVSLAVNHAKRRNSRRRVHKEANRPVDPHFCAEVNRPQHVVEASFGPVEAAGFPFESFEEASGSLRTGFPQPSSSRMQPNKCQPPRIDVAHGSRIAASKLLYKELRQNALIVENHSESTPLLFSVLDAVAAHGWTKRHQT